MTISTAGSRWPPSRSGHDIIGSPDHAPAAGVSDEAPCGQLAADADADGRIVAANLRFADWAGWPASELVGKPFKALLSPASRILYETHYVPLLEAQGFASEVMLELLRPDRERVSVLICAIRRRDGGAEVSVFDARETRRHERELTKARQVAEDAASALKTVNAALVRQTEELRVTLRSIGNGVVTTDDSGRISSINLKAQTLLGIDEARAIGEPLAVLGDFRRAGSGRRLRFTARARRRWPFPTIEVQVVLPDGVTRQISGTAAPIDGPGGGTVFVCRDVTDERRQVRQLAYDASHDHLTGLLNRREFERRLDQSMQAAAPGGTGDLLCYVDLDQFKIINDTAGHVAGDQLLIEVGRVLRRTIRESDALARLGGDEFGIILQACGLEAGARVAEEVRTSVAALRFQWEGQAFSVTASIGLSACEGAGADPVAALAVADMACHAAKESGRNRVRTFEADDPALLAQRDAMGWMIKIHKAIEDDLLSLSFQPIARMVEKVGARQHGELLLRLREADGSVVSPAGFIAAAERYQQMQPIDSWVVHRALEWLRGVPDIVASINLSGQSVGDSRFLEFVVRELHSSGVEPERVCFEITETAAMSDLNAALTFMNSLRALGVRFALDDFGVGLSSFSYLQTLPVDYLKIDGSFTKSLLDSPVNRAIVESIAKIARMCGLETVAECVETAEIQAALGHIGIDHLQGWHIGRPAPIESIVIHASPVEHA